MARILSLSFIFICCTITLFAQGAGDPPKIIPPTPNAAALGKFGDVPVSLYTGQLGLSIPIHTIQVNGFSLPISLTYSNNGFKMEEYPSWVGHGWTLNAGGVITRQVRGLEDEYVDGYNGLHSRGLDALRYINGQMQSAEALTFVDRIVKRIWDAEPDMFNFNCAGISGKFFFDESQCGTNIKTAILSPYQNVIVTGVFDYTYIYHIKQGSIREFTIKDDSGNKYFFQTLEAPSGSIDPLDPDRDSFVNTWFLSKIQTTNFEEINFVYEYRDMDLPPAIQESKYIQMQITGEYVYENPYKKHVSRSTTSEAILKEITYRGGKVKFIEGAERSDWGVSMRYAADKPRSLDRIEIYDYNNAEIKTVRFTYNGGTNRLRLDQIQEFRQNLPTSPPHIFTYNENTMPPIGDENIYGQDYWGYYNGISSTSLLPTYYGFATIFATGEPAFIHIPGADRTSVPGMAMTGILEKVTYPTGGTSSFFYEGNSFYGKGDTFGFNPCGFSDVIATATSGGAVENAYQDFTVAPNLLCFELEYDLLANCDGAEVYVMISDPAGGGQKYFRQVRALLNPPQSGVGRETITLPPGNYRLSVYSDIEHCQTNRSIATIRGTTVGPAGMANLNAGGVRIARTVDCPENGDLCKTKKYLYVQEGDPSRSSGVLVNLPLQSYDKQVVLDNVTGIGGSGTIQYLAYKVLTASSNIPLATTQGSFVGYSEVTVLEGENGENGKTVHKFHTATEFPDLGSTAFPFPPRSSMDWRRGANHTTIVSRKTGGSYYPLQSTVRFFEFNPSLPVAHNYNRTIGIKTGEFQEYQTTGAFPGDVLVNNVIVPYSIVTGNQYLASEDAREFTYTGNTLAATMLRQTSYQYENNKHVQPTRITTVDSKGQTTETRVRYPGDAASIANLSASDQATLTTMQNWHIHSPVIEKQEYINGALASTSRTTYKQFSPTLILPEKSWKATGTGPLEPTVQFLSYDAIGNPVSYTTDTDAQSAAGVLRTSVQWGYNGLFPIAQVVNAQPGAFFYSSFEDVVVNATAAAAKTGKLSYTEAYTVPHPAPGTAYQLTYWQKVGTGPWQFQQQTVTGNTTIGASGTLIDEVRLVPPSAQLTSYTYDPRLGMTSSTDANNNTSYYEYDENARLKLIRDDNGDIIKSFIYHYKAQD